MALLALPFPAAASGQPAPLGTEDAPAGITVTGIGFGRDEAVAVDHAIRDARDRAALVAVALGADTGPIEKIEMPELPLLRSFSRRCSRAADPKAAVCRKVAATTVTFGIPGAGEEVTRTVTAESTGSEPVEPRRPNSDRWIKRALVTAREQATRSAALAAKNSAQTAAAAADLKLGAVVSATESRPTGPLPFLEPSFTDPLLGVFGAGVYCKSTEARARRRCAYPSSYETRVEVRYAIA